MGIVSVHEIHEGRGGEDSIGKLQTIEKLTRCFRVITNSNYDCSHEVKNATGIPLLADRHPSNTDAYCNSKRADPDKKGKRIWVVTCQYTTERQNPDGSGPQSDPQNDRAIIEWATESMQVPIYADFFDHAILNSAGDYFAEGVKAEANFWLVTVSKNLRFVPAWILNYRNAVNSDAFLLDGIAIPTKAAKMRQIQIGKWNKRNRLWYREVKFTIKIQGSWRKWILDQGLRCIKDGQTTACSNNDGTMVTKPVALDGDGGQLENPSPTNAQFLEFQIYPELPFSALPLY